ncbi:MAG: hypothetical protein WCD11_00555 [Solirubrobacteraceae bacterium]
MSSKRPWEYLSGDMNWQGAVVGLCLLALLIADFAILGSTTAGYVGAAVIVLISAVSLRTTAHRRG